MKMSHSLFLLFCIAIASSAFAGDLKCSWTTQAVRVDGKSDEWSGAASAFFEDQSAVVMASSDSAFLYILFRTNDIKSVRAIKGTGITLFLDAKAGKKKDFSLKFRGGPSMEQLKPRQNEIQTMDRQASSGMKTQQFPDSMHLPTVLLCNIDKWLIDKELSLDGAHGPMAAFDTSQGFYTYEFRVPLAEATAQYYGINAKPGQKIAIGAVWGGMAKDESMKPEMEAGFGDFGGGSGGIEGGSMRDRARKNRPYQSEMTKGKKQEIWVKAILANQTK